MPTIICIFLFSLLYFFLKSNKNLNNEKFLFVKCNECNRNININHDFCPNCSNPIQIICDHCNKKNNIKWRKCPYCGTTRNNEETYTK